MSTPYRIELAIAFQNTCGDNVWSHTIWTTTTTTLSGFARQSLLSSPSGKPRFVPTLVLTDLLISFPTHVPGQCPNDAPSIHTEQTTAFGTNVDTHRDAICQGPFQHVAGQCQKDALLMAPNNVRSKQLSLKPTWTPTGMPSGDR
eukprot:scaffold90906_cov33-Attheya_sp.AAC.2